MNPTGMMKVYEKKYVHEKERNEILAQRCNNQHEEIMMLKNKMEKLKRQADTNMKYNQDRDEDEEENLYYENAENPEVVEDTRSRKAGRSSSSSSSNSSSSSTSSSGNSNNKNKNISRTSHAARRAHSHPTQPTHHRGNTFRPSTLGYALGRNVFRLLVCWLLGVAVSTATYNYTII